MEVLGWIFMVIIALVALVIFKIWWGVRSIGKGMRMYKGNTYTEAEYQEVRKKEKRGS